MVEQRLGLAEVRSHVLIVALDEQTVEICKKEQLKYIAYFPYIDSRINTIEGYRGAAPPAAMAQVPFHIPFHGVPH
eukprot:7690645-Pyramimonas_sp.AAC.1